MRHHRRRRGMSAQELADATAALGYPIARSVIANLESGRRSSVLVAELVILAKAIGVPPIVLLYPTGRKDTVEALPGVELPLWTALSWFTAEGGYAENEWLDDQSEPESDGWLAIRLYRNHWQLAWEWNVAMDELSSIREFLESPTPDLTAERAKELRQAEKAEDRELRAIESDLFGIRDSIWELGLKLPTLDPVLEMRMGKVARENARTETHGERVKELQQSEEKVPRLRSRGR
ncbi:helix-turn-helix domain-containing protein [Protofrankia sp. BMG5.30]|uniref:helix-turn-helix domain-containing protein n=1 Tax=Protofrankia sp. BMG5.30 TaxID=1834514 RepID=UPI00210F837B|nr:MULTISPECIES: helix-turn-helix domain-containing protein [Protofrankia]